MTRLMAVAFLAACAMAQPVADYKALKFPPLREVKPPEPVFFTLPNGMKVFLLEDHELPLISGSALVRTGNLFDPSDKRGLADLTGSIMRSGGTKAKSGDQLDEDLESVAASVEASIGESNGNVSFSCLKENVDLVMGIFKDVMTQPEFRQDKVDLAKMQAHSGISRRNDDAAGIASREFASAIYGRNTPWGWTIEYEHVDRIERADMVRFHQRYFFPKNLILSIYGDFSAVAMKAKLASLFATWTAEQLPVPPFPPMDKAKRPGIQLAERDDVTQRGRAREQHRDAIEAEGDATVRRSASAKPLEQEAEAFLGGCLVHPDQSEDLLLYGGIADSNAAAAKLGAVEYEIIGECPRPGWIAVEKSDVVRMWRGEWETYDLPGGTYTLVLTARDAQNNVVVERTRHILLEP